MGSSSMHSRFIFGQNNSYYGGLKWNYDATGTFGFLSVGNMNGTNTNGFNIYQNGYVGLGKINPTCEFDMVGDFKSSGNATIGGTSTGLSVFQQGMVVNESGDATSAGDFRAETGNVTNAIHLKAATDELTFGTSVAYVYAAKTANYTLSATDYQIECTANSFTVTLPTAVGCTGRVYSIKNSGAGTITVDGNGTETIDGDLTADLIQYENLKIMSNNTNWIVIS